MEVKELNFVLKRINDLLREVDMTRTTLSIRSDIDINVINNWFSKNTIPSTLSVKKIAEDGFGLSLANFYSLDNMVELTPDLVEYIHQIKALDEKDRELVLELVRKLKKGDH